MTDDQIREDLDRTSELLDRIEAKLDEIASGVEGQNTRITELLQKIADLEAEIKRRDEVVIKMAQKYQLVEKDEFGDQLVADANNDGVPDIFQAEEPKKD